jgi:hypothetical protein
MSALTQVPPVQPAQSQQPLQLDAFSSAMTTASAALTASPDAMGKTLMSGIDSFNASEAQFRNTVAEATAPESAQPAPAAGAATPLDPGAPHGMTTAQVIQKGQTLNRQSLGMMMQTYSFALEATLVTNAATTFTSSVNTLIKTQ